MTPPKASENTKTSHLGVRGAGGSFARSRMGVVVTSVEHSLIRDNCQLYVSAADPTPGPPASNQGTNLRPLW